MSEQIIEDNWPLGWCPSNSLQSDFGAASQALLRMDNLTLDEKGSLRSANRPTASGSIPSSVQSIHGALMASNKYRYAYGANGSLYRNYGGSNSLTVFDKILGTGAAVNKAGFLTALGHTLCLAGTVQIKDRGDINWPITIPQPTAPTLTNQAAAVINLSNLDGGGNYTNWTSVASGTFVNAGTDIHFTPPATNVAVAQTIYGSVIDTTNFGVTGEDTPDDPFVFTIKVDDPTLLNWFKIELICTDPTTGITDEFWAELDYANFATNTNPNNPYVPSNPFTLTPNTPLQVYIARSSFQRLGNNAAYSMATIKACRFSVGFFGSATFTFSGLFVQNGAVTGDIEYVAVELNDTGQYLQYSISSVAVAVNSSLNYVKVDRSGTPCNAQCNQIRFYRNSQTLGQYLEVNRQTGAYGFTPAFFIDNIPDNTIIADAAADTSKVLQYYRTNLPTTIIDGVYFAGRVIYLTSHSFLPSFALDLGSYDSRFTYELNSTNSEQCLFISKLSVGTFIIATTVDFYQVSGSFALINTTNADGTITSIQDVTVNKLGISDPAISRDFMEVEGNILYMSANGLRSMSNGVSSLLNTTTELLFRNENRYGIPPVALTSGDTSLIGLVSSGTRLYAALPFGDGVNRIMVSTFNPPLPEQLRGATYWRLLTVAAQCLNKEQDGTVLYGDSAGAIGTLESAFTGTLPIYFETQFNYGQHPSQTKSLGSLLLYVNTGGVDLTLTITGITENGTMLTYTTTINSAALEVLAIDPHGTLPLCLAYQMTITGTTGAFELAYGIYVTVQDYPPLTFYAIVPFSNLGKDTLKKLSKWGFVVDPLSSTVTAKVTADAAVVSSELSSGPGITTEFWYNVADLAALDWQLELTSDTGMHLYKFMPPDILQVYPPGRKLDQFGPLDLDREGIAFMLRLRLINTGATVHINVLDNDTAVFNDDIITSTNLDSTYEITFPKGINTSVLRILISSPTVFYRFSAEVKVRSTGKETEQKWVKIGT